MDRHDIREFLLLFLTTFLIVTSLLHLLLTR